MREPALLQSDLFVTTISDEQGLQCFLWVYGYPINESKYPIFFRDKIIVEVNDGEQILFKICDKCFAELTKATDFECTNCNHK